MHCMLLWQQDRCMMSYHSVQDLCETWIGTPWTPQGADHNCGGCGNDCTRNGQVCGASGGSVQCVSPGDHGNGHGRDGHGHLETG